MERTVQRVVKCKLEEEEIKQAIVEYMDRMHGDDVVLEDITFYTEMSEPGDFGKVEAIIDSATYIREDKK